MKRLGIIFEEIEVEDIYGSIMTDVMHGGSKISDVKYNGPAKGRGSSYEYNIHMIHQIGYESVWNVSINITHGFEDCYLNHIIVLDRDGKVVLKNDRDGYGRFFTKWLKEEIQDIIKPLAIKRDNIESAHDDKSYQDSEAISQQPYPYDWNSDWPNNEPTFDKEGDIDKFEKERLE